MARISHYLKGGLNIYFTPDEYVMLGNAKRCDATIHLKSEREFVRLHTNPSGRYAVSPQPRNKTHPWRLQLPTQALPPFGVEAVAASIVAGGVLAIARPTQMTDPMFRSSPAASALSPEIRKIERIVRQARKAPGQQPTQNAYQHLNLRELIEALNMAWSEMGGELEISVDQVNHRVTARHMVEY